MSSLTDEVVIVGSGPVGLAMATELSRQNVACRIIDKKDGPSRYSKALGISPRTMEVFDQWGVIDRFLDAGNRLFAVNVYSRRERIARVEFRDLKTPYPFMLALPQCETERILIGLLAEQGIEVDWGCELESLSDFGDEVHVRTRATSGQAEVREYRWLIGCDGAHSSVRKQLDLPFHGAAYPDSLLLADVTINSHLDRHELHAFFHEDGPIVFIPLAGEVWRVIVVDVPAADDHETGPTLADVQAYVDLRGPEGLRLKSANWTSKFRISRRRVAQYRKGHVLLAGDAAHICSPAGGQGMNMGIQDAANLGWKLPLVMRKTAADELLDSYELEREPVAANTLEWTEQLTELLTLDSELAQKARNFAFSLLSHLNPLTERMATHLAELDVHYRESPITMDDLSHGGMRTRHSAVGAGDRAPDATLRSLDPSIGQVRIFELLRDPRHVLLIFHADHKEQLIADNIESEFLAVRRQMQDEFSGLVTTYDITESSITMPQPLPTCLLVDEGSAHKRYGVAAPSWFLIRPDGYIGFHSSSLDQTRLADFVRTIICSHSAGTRREQLLHDKYVMGEGF